jgi:uncharacterized lipoprotein YmbA
MMRLSFYRTPAVLALIISGSLLFGCLSSKPPAKRFYVLNPLEGDVALEGEANRKETLSIEVASPQLPRYLERPQIVTREGPNRLELAEYHLWGGKLRKNITRVLAKNLSQLLDTPNIFISPHHPRVPPDFRVELAVMKFERDIDGYVRISSQWHLSRGKNGVPLVTRITELASPGTVPENDFDQITSAMGRLLGELSRVIAREIIVYIPGKSGS